MEGNYFAVGNDFRTGKRKNICAYNVQIWFLSCALQKSYLGISFLQSTVNDNCLSLLLLSFYGFDCLQPTINRNHI